MTFSRPPQGDDHDWWRGAVIYQVYPRHATSTPMVMASAICRA
ncbi:hypothetical protein ACGTNG_01610 [Halomonas sp. 1390]